MEQLNPPSPNDSLSLPITIWPVMVLARHGFWPVMVSGFGPHIPQLSKKILNVPVHASDCCESRVTGDDNPRVEWRYIPIVGVVDRRWLGDVNLKCLLSIQGDILGGPVSFGLLLVGWFGSPMKPLGASGAPYREDFVHMFLFLYTQWLTGRYRERIWWDYRSTPPQHLNCLPCIRTNVPTWLGGSVTGQGYKGGR